jgi:2-(1,2-epoxy-1,2-dihydrophenyl)acetyl-CoA isomerase
MRLEREGDVAIVVLANPTGANTIDFEYADELCDIGHILRQEGWARAIMLRAEGKLFCGGGNLQTLRTAAQEGGPQLAACLRRLADRLHAGIEALLALGAPIIAAVDGAAAGAGMSLVLMADLAYATPRAKLVPSYPAVGLSADGGMTYFLPRIVGVARAASILMNNRTLPATEAFALGIFAELIDLPRDAFEAAVFEKAQALARGPRAAFAAIRRLLGDSLSNSLSAQLSHEAIEIEGLAFGADASAGLLAAASGRAPHFKD